MRLRGWQLVALLIGIGTVGRMVWAFATYGNAFDLGSCLLVHEALATDPLNVYSDVTFTVGGVDQFRWPYPPLFFAWIEIASWIEDSFGIAFHGLVQLPMIFADAALAAIVYAVLGARGASERTRLLAVALVAFGPAFAVISGYHVQIDALAILPAVIGVVLWQRGGERRALAVGLLIGVGAALKTVPLLALVALVPTARNLREASVLSAAAIAVPALLLLPFLIADPEGALGIFRYNGAPGLGGISLVLQPDLAADWFTDLQLDPTAASEWLADLRGVPTLIALAAAGLFLLRYRPAALDGIVLVWLVVYVFSPNMFLHYAIWGLPFMLLAGYVRWVLIAELWLLIPFVITYGAPWASRDVALVYSPLMIGLWLLTIAALVVLGRRIVAGRRDHPGRVQPPLVSFASEPAAAATPAPTHTAPGSG